jgi:RNA polymerase sigma-70 factor, ECF subfamily
MASTPVQIKEPESQHAAHDRARAADEAVLVARAQAGDEAAFSRLVEPYLHLAYHVALRITGNREDAEDVSQQSLMKAFTRLNQFHGEARFSTWLTRIAINEALMKIRQRHSEENYITHDTETDEKPSVMDLARAGDSEHPETIYARWENGRILREAINGLRAGTRAVVWLLGIEERKTKETARLLKLSESAVKSRFLRGRQQLRECLGDRF